MNGDLKALEERADILEQTLDLHTALRVDASFKKDPERWTLSYTQHNSQSLRARAVGNKP